MNNTIKILNLLSIFLLFSILLWQADWMLKFQKTKVEELKHQSNSILSKEIQQFFNISSFIIFTNSKHNLTYSLDSTKKTLQCNYNQITKTIPIKTLDSFPVLINKIIYDYLFSCERFNIHYLDSLFQKALQQQNIFDTPILIIKDSIGQELFSSGPHDDLRNPIQCKPIDLGYDYHHQLIVLFEEPTLLSTLKEHLLLESLFLIGFMICFIWQWRLIKWTWQSAKVQITSMAHFEHEMGKPLTAMKMSIERILEENKSTLSGPNVQRLENMKARLGKMANMKENMLSTLKKDKIVIKRQIIDVQQEIRLLIDLFAVIRPQAQITATISPEVQEAFLDETYFHHVVMNLIDNGIKYNNKKPIIRIDCYRENSNFVCSIEDNGIGIPASKQKHIFKRFYRINDKRMKVKTGFGLGLSFIKRVIKAYKGTIKIESKPEEGSKFIIIIPQ